MAEQVENDLVFYFMEMKVKKTIHWIIPHFTRKLAEKAKVGEKLESLQFALVFDGHKTVWYEQNYFIFELKFLILVCLH